MVEHAVVWPRSPRTVPPAALAPRLATLDGATVAFLWDDLFRGDEIFPIIEAELGARFADTRFIGYDAFGSTHGDHEHQVIATMATRLRELGVDAVVSGMGC